MTRVYCSGILFPKKPRNPKLLTNGPRVHGIETGLQFATEISLGVRGVLGTHGNQGPD